MNDWQKVRLGPQAVSIGLFICQAGCLLGTLSTTVKDGLSSFASLPIFSVPGITAISGATGLTVALFLWLTQRTSNQEYGVNLGDLYFWACPCYLLSFFLFVFSTLAALYLGNHTNNSDYSIWIIAFSACTILGVVTMAIMCCCFIFSSNTRRHIAHAFLLFKIRKTSGAEQEGWFELLLASMDTRLKQNDAKGIEDVFQVVDSFGAQIFPAAKRGTEPSLCYRQQYIEDPGSNGDCEMNLFRYYLWVWERLMASVDNKKNLFRLAYKRFSCRDAGIPQLVWLYALTRAALPPIWPDGEAAIEFQFVNYLSTLDHSNNDNLSLEDKEALLCQFCCFYRLYIKFRAAMKGENTGEDEENTLRLLSEIVESSPYQLDKKRYQLLANHAAQLLMINSCWSDKDFEFLELSAKGGALLAAMEQEQQFHDTIFHTAVDAENREEVQMI